MSSGPQPRTNKVEKNAVVEIEEHEALEGVQAGDKTRRVGCPGEAAKEAVGDEMVGPADVVGNSELL
jgi:hypothetical protein